MIVSLARGFGQNYTGQGNFLLQPLDANELIADISDLLGASVARRVTLTITLAPNLPAIVADAAQMRQALAQLMTNAAEVIGEANGTISVTTSVCELDQAVLSTIYHAPDLPAGHPDNRDRDVRPRHVRRDDLVHVHRDRHRKRNLDDPDLHDHRGRLRRRRDRSRQGGVRRREPGSR